MDHRGTVGRIYEEDHYTLLYTKLESSGPCGFREDFFYVLPNVSLWELMTPGAFLTQGAWLAGFLKRTTIHCYIQNMKALGLVVSEKKIFLCFSHDIPRVGPVWTPGARLAGFIEDHYTLLHTKYESSGPCGFGEVFLCFFPLQVYGSYLLPWKPEFLSNLAKNLMQPFPPPQ